MPIRVMLMTSSWLCVQALESVIADSPNPDHEQLNYQGIKSFWHLRRKCGKETDKVCRLLRLCRSNRIRSPLVVSPEKVLEMDIHRTLYGRFGSTFALILGWTFLAGCSVTPPRSSQTPYDLSSELVRELQGADDSATSTSNADSSENIIADSNVRPVTFTEDHVDVHLDVAGNPLPDGPSQDVPNLRLAGPGKEPPKELAKMALPKYRLEPPDVLLIDVLRLVPKAPYEIQPFDVLEIVAPGSNPDFPLADYFQVEPNGNVNLGALYGSVKVSGMTLREAQDAIRQHLSAELSTPQLAVSLAQIAGQQQIAGEHLVGPDGSLTLGTYGSVYVSGMTLDEAREAIEEHLSKFLEEPKISLDVFAYNSKVYYVIIEGAGFGDGVVRLPVTGNETVLDAMALIGGTQRQSNKRKMWIARPAPSGVGCDQILPIDWVAITKGGSTQTNYQILPGDRIFIGEDKFILLDGTIAKITAPFERMLGFSLLGGQTIQLLQRFPEGRFVPF